MKLRQFQSSFDLCTLVVSPRIGVYIRLHCGYINVNYCMYMLHRKLITVDQFIIIIWDQGSEKGPSTL